MPQAGRGRRVRKALQHTRHTLSQAGKKRLAQRLRCCSAHTCTWLQRLLLWTYTHVHPRKRTRNGLEQKWRCRNDGTPHASSCLCAQYDYQHAVVLYTAAARAAGWLNQRQQTTGQHAGRSALRQAQVGGPGRHAELSWCRTTAPGMRSATAGCRPPTWLSSAGTPPTPGSSSLP